MFFTESFPVTSAWAFINLQSSNLGFKWAISGFWTNASFFKGLNKPVFLKLISYLKERHPGQLDMKEEATLAKKIL